MNFGYGVVHSTQIQASYEFPKASVVKTRNQVKDIPVHQERVFSFVAILLFYNTKVRIKSDKQKNVAKLLAARRTE